MKRFLYPLVCLCLLIGSTARANFVNGSFETGNFMGWETLGTTNVVGTIGGIAPPNGNFQAQLVAGAQPAATVATFLGTTVAQLQAANVPGGGTLFPGSAIRQTITVNAGDVISFNWNFLNAEGVGSFFNDASFVVLAVTPGTGNAPILLANTNTAGQIGGGPTGLQTGYRTFTSAPLAVGGQVTVGVGVFNVNDNAVASQLLVDNFQVTGSIIPEPGSLTLLGLGVVGLVGGYAWRRRKTA